MTHRKPVHRKPVHRKTRALKSLAEMLDLPIHKSLQDWSKDLAERNQLKNVLDFYDSLIDENEKFLLMGIMVQAANEQFESNGFCNTWERIEQWLTWDFYIHRLTILHWTFPHNDSQDLCRPITADMRELWSMQSLPRKRILFVCTVNLMRSATAHKIYSNDLRFEVKSAGTHRSAETVLSNELLEWAEFVLVMEDRHRNFIQRTYPAIYDDKNIICLDVPDNYDYMQSELIVLLRDRVEEVIGKRFI